MAMGMTQAIVTMTALCAWQTAFAADETSSPRTVSASARSQATETSGVLDEIVVTAERRSESLQEVPVSIQAFTAAELEATRTFSVTDLQLHVPGIFMTRFSGYGQIYIRGIGNDSLTQGAENSVAVYLDGVYQGRPMGSLFEFVDVERVEVLRGPQGTLYGRNATGGAINIISKSSTRELEARGEVEFSSQDGRTLRMSASGPLSGTAAARLSVVAKKEDGAVRNALLGTNGNNADFLALRGSLELTPSDVLTVAFNARHSESKSRLMIKLVVPEVTRRVAPAYSVFHAEWIDDFYTVKSNTPGNLQARQTSIDAMIRLDAHWGRLTSVTAAREESLDMISVDYDGSEVNFVAGGPIFEHTQFVSEDLTLVSNSEGPLSWTALASFVHQDVDYGNKVTVAPVGIVQDAPGSIATDAMGIGGQAGYTLGKVTLTGGVRYSRESKENSEVSTINGNVVARQDEKKTWTAWTPRLVAEYAATDRVMVYASATKGFKSGAYNTQTIGPAWEPEKVTSYEVGVKSTWLGGKLRINGALFHMQYSDLQVQRSALVNGRIVTITSNAAKATSKGLELDLVASPTPNLQLSGGLQVLRAEYDQYVQIDPFNPLLGQIDLAGHPLPYAPHLTVNFGMQYTWPQALGGADVALRMDGYRRSKVYYTSFTDPLGSEKIPFLGSAQLSLQPADGAGLYGAVFVRNITDRHYHEMVRAGSGGYASYPGLPRTFGATVGYRF